jgi:pyruvate/2-oxoglutarate dehydrogenase complex dihydrolipoamide acyltransferase (E2) component
MEIPSSHAGVVKELKVKLGDKVNEGTLVLVLEVAAGAAAAPAAACARGGPAPLPPVPRPRAAPAACRRHRPDRGASCPTSATSTKWP